MTNVYRVPKQVGPGTSIKPGERLYHDFRLGVVTTKNDDNSLPFLGLCYGSASDNDSSVDCACVFTIEEKEAFEDGDTILHLAVKNNASASHIKALLQEGVDVNAQNNDGDTALHIALGYTTTEDVCLLLDAGADASIKNNEGETPLSIAARCDIPAAIFVAMASQILLKESLVGMSKKGWIGF